MIPTSSLEFPFAIVRRRGEARRTVGRMASMSDALAVAFMLSTREAESVFEVEGVEGDGDTGGGGTPIQCGLRDRVWVKMMMRF